MWQQNQWYQLLNRVIHSNYGSVLQSFLDVTTGWTVDGLMWTTNTPSASLNHSNQHACYCIIPRRWAGKDLSEIENWGNAFMCSFSLHIFIRSTSKSRPNNIRGKKCLPVRPSVRPSVHKKFLQFE